MCRSDEGVLWRFLSSDFCLNNNMAKSCRLYCAVFGCFNSSLTHPNLLFFKLPSNSERRLQWLQLIRRDDLQKKSNFAAYRICEKHFDADDIRQTATRKLLKRNAKPLFMLPSLASTVPEFLRTEDKQSQTDLSIKSSIQVDNCTQTINRTLTSPSSNTRSKRKFQNELLRCRKKIKLLENKTQQSEETTFHHLCDKFLDGKLSLLVKAHSNLKRHNTGNRYDQDYVNFCLKLYCINSQAYRFLQTELCLPCPSTLYKRSFPTTAEIKDLKLQVTKTTEPEEQEKL